MSDDSLRDTFAAAALTGLLAQVVQKDRTDDDVAELAFVVADAMLRERDRTAPSTLQVAPMSDPASTPQEPRQLDKAVMGWISEVTAALEDMDCVSDTAKGEIDSARCECGDAIQAMFRSSVGVSATGAESGSTPDAQGFGRSNEYPCQPFDSAPTTDQDRFNAAVMNWISEATSLYQPRSEGGRSILSSACMECWSAYGKHSTNHDAAPAARARTDADRNRTDKAALRPGKGTGDTTANRDTTQPRNGAASEPVAWAVDCGGVLDVSFVGRDARSEAAEWCDRANDRPVPLYRTPQPTLTPEERMAVAWAVDAASNDEHPAEDALRGLLERMK